MTDYVLEPTEEELRKLETSQCYFDYEGDLEDFYSEIENLEELKVPMKQKPIRLTLQQEKV